MLTMIYALMMITEGVQYLSRAYEIYEEVGDLNAYAVP